MKSFRGKKIIATVARAAKVVEIPDSLRFERLETIAQLHLAQDASAVGVELRLVVILLDEQKPVVRD
jgi:hypothetical protein